MIMNRLILLFAQLYVTSAYSAVGSFTAKMQRIAKVRKAMLTAYFFQLLSRRDADNHNN